MGQTNDDNTLMILIICHNFAKNDNNRKLLERAGVTVAMNFAMKHSQGAQKEGDNNKLILLGLKVNALISPPLPKAEPLEALEVHQSHIEWNWPRSLV